MSRPPNLFTLAYDALLRPGHFAAFLAGERRALLWAALAVAEALLVVDGFILLVLRQLLPLGLPALVYSLGVAPLLALMVAGLCVIVSGSLPLSPQVNAAFWIARCQIAITPVLALFLALATSPALPQLQRAPAITFLFLILVGAWCGGAIGVFLALRPRGSKSAPVRWLLAGGALAIGVALWLSPPLRATPALLLAPACVGLAIGLLRPLSYLWEASWSLLLWLAARLGAPIERLRALHPASYDDLCLLPLSGLSSLLACACAADLEAGGAWLLDVARHLGQSGAAGRAIERMVHGGRLAHPLLFWLSTGVPGAALLRVLADSSDRPDALIEAYAACTRPGTPAAWPTLIADQRAAFASAAHLPGGASIMALLDVGAGTLGATRWPAAIDRLRAAPALFSEDDPIWIALDILQIWAQDRLPALADDRAAALRALAEEVYALEGWPAALIAAMSEHLLFLLGVERRRGAWLA
jgi:hypothetical protein